MKSDNQIQFTQPSMPRGSIILWYGTIATIPGGWALCDGSNGTPDLRNQFIVGAHSDSGGDAKTTIRGVAEKSGGAIMHNHEISHEAANPSITYQLGEYFDSYTYHTEHLPPYYALAYIMKL